MTGGSARPLPPSVAHRLAAYRTLLARERAPALRGLYLVGSIALDDFRDGISDIDVVALLDEPPGPEALARLAAVHAALARTEGPCLDALYLCTDTLARPPSAPAVIPFVVEGAFVTDRPCFEVSPVTWRILARHARTVFGPRPCDLAIADGSRLLRSHQIDNLRTYWTSWIGQFEAALEAGRLGPKVEARHLAWGVTGVSRIACTLATGRMVSKTEAGRWALTSLPPEAHPVLADALAARDGTLRHVSAERFRAGLSLMRLVIDEATGYQAPAAPPDSRP